MKVLVTYASVHGSTAEVAQKIATILGEDGLDVTVETVQNVSDVQPYDGVIIGSAVHAGAWLPEISTLMESLDEVSASKPFYLWLSCIRVLEQEGEEHVRDYYLNHQLLKTLNVRDTAIFAGKLDLATTDWEERWALAARYDGGTWPSGFDGDFRDWDKIQAWAKHIARDLLAVKTLS